MWHQASTALAGLLLLGVLAAGRPAADRGVTADPVQPAFVDETVLFAFDNVSIAATDNLALTMHRPEKHPANPVVPLGARGEPDEWP